MNLRFKKFLFGCITVRLLVACIALYLGHTSSLRWLLPYMASIALLVSIGFLWQYIGGFREHGHGFAGGPIWWSNMRPIHGTMYLLFALYAFREKKFAWKVLFVDTLIGLIAGINHYIF